MAIYREQDGGVAIGAAAQAGGVEAARQALRATFDADNHETLSREVTALMLILSRIPYHPDDSISVARVAPDIGERAYHDGAAYRAGGEAGSVAAADGRRGGEGEPAPPGILQRLKSLIR